MDPDEHTIPLHLRYCSGCARFFHPEYHTCEEDGTALTRVVERLEPGGIVGVYRLHHILGSGASGTVYAAEHAVTRRRVAVKIVHPDARCHGELARSIFKEARAVAALRHPNLIDVLHLGATSNGRPYIVTEFLEGEGLDAHLDRHEALSCADALAVAADVARGLAAAHHAGIVHHDVKPSNVFLLAPEPDQPRLKIIDFGAAAFVSESLERSACVAGTPSYMAPEHIEGNDGDPRSDLYALGVTMFEMMTGRLPFYGESPREIMIAHLTKPIAQPIGPGGALPSVVESLVRRATMKDPASRFQSAAEMGEAIQEASKALARTAHGGRLMAFASTLRHRLAS